MAVQHPADDLVREYEQHVYERALLSSGSEPRAQVARQEARAQASGDYGPDGLAAYRRWLDARGLDAGPFPPNDVRD